MERVVSNILTNVTSGEMWRIILTIIPFVCSITGILIGVNLIWRLLNWKLDTRFHKRWAKRAFRKF